NSANSSFINRLPDPRVSEDELIADPVEKWASAQPKAHPSIPLPRAIYGERPNSQGYDLNVSEMTTQLTGALKKHRNTSWKSVPVMNGQTHSSGATRQLANPADRHHNIGTCRDTLPGEIFPAMENLTKNFPAWAATPVAKRAAPFEKLANKLEQNRDE